MGKRGPAPKPTNIRILEGNLSKRPFNSREPEPQPGEPALPVHLDAKARRIWRQLVPLLLNMRVLTEADGEALGTLAAICAVERRLLKAIREKGDTFKTGSGYIQQRPEWGLLNKLWQLKRVYLGEFGMSPASRSRIQQHGAEVDDLDALLG